MKTLGIYIHIPFCLIKCPYCDFVSVVMEDEEVYEKYVNALKKELLLYKEEISFKIDTIYFGGGTPSVLKPEFLGDVLECIYKNFNVEDSEITVEVNPKTYRYEDFKKIKSLGINRVSIGSQTLSERFLKSLGRDHKPEDTLKTVEDAINAGINNINLDLIYGIENQTLKDLEEDLKMYTSLPITHVSAYMLTAYEDTPLGSMVLDGKYNLPDEKTTTEMFFLIDEFLENKGYFRYELSNWAKNSFECRHNLKYWLLEPFLGVGVSSWSFMNKKRFGNTKNLQEYFKALESGKKPVAYVDELSDEDLKFERIMLGLRLREGIELSLLEDKKEQVEFLVNEGFAKVENNRFFLTVRGLTVINKIVLDLSS